jgi:hypothetical protein
MEQFEQRWKQVEELLNERFGKVPDMEGILFLIGINELGAVPNRKFSKEQKQDLMHIAVCSLLATQGYYELAGTDDDGWPHYNKLQAVSANDLQSQEQLLKECVVLYFGQ